MVVSATSFAAIGTENQPYINVVWGDVEVRCERTSGVNLGGACFSLDGTESVAAANITDDRSASVCAAYAFNDANDAQLGEIVPFADSVEDIDIPEGAATFFVFTDGPLFATLDCGDPAKIGTTGTVTATLS